MLPLASAFTRIEDLMATWGYPVLFGALFSCGLGVPLPEDVPLLLAGYFVAIGKMHIAIAAVCAWLGIVGGDCVLYYFGYHYGLNITKVPVIGKHVTAARIKYVELKFQRYGTWVVAVGRMVAGIRGAMVIAAGTIRFSFWRFVVADGLAAVISGGIFLGIGYYAGKKLGDLDAISREVQHYEREVIMYGAVALVLFLAYLYLKKKWNPPHPIVPTLEVQPHTVVTVKSDVDAPTPSA